MTRIEILPLTYGNQSDLNRCDNSFTVEAEIRLELPCHDAGPIAYRVQPVEPYLKHYRPEPYDPEPYISRADRAAWLGYVGDRLAGQILVRENWNGLAIVWDIAVNPEFRRQGVGRRLMEQAIDWARERSLAGVMLETQNINVPACRLYERCGFVLGGFDRFLYRGVLPGTREIALFWYLLFSPR